ncbi:hypothetical protein A6A03_12955 [Chloroflexus islandicus]|uniref:KAP NTPase domain-containing protein n=1 Tax=Chloroflexus islandicus TaxID=1707952 RepID=A0A178MC00_9CHLR|nr:P-loop NTPase fold protein [Chloroflexus islandicus]OAN46282.1 hypothetical protein A6A03_12955 [Chloroflexus islandicus]
MKKHRYVVQRPFLRFDHRITDIDHLADDLRRSSLANIIANDILSERPPSVIGVYGAWGSGKSYLLSQVIRELLERNRKGGKQQAIVCAFNPWQYEMEQNLAAGLIKTLANIESQFPDHQQEKGYQLHNPSLGGKTTHRLIASYLIDLLIEVSPLVVPGGGVAAAAGKAIRSATTTFQQTKDQRAQPLLIDEVKGKMAELVEAILDSAHEADATKQKQYRLVIFIDDLDRCSPEQMVRMFEWLKVHMLVEGCTYVLALDHIAAARAIVGRYREYLGEDQDLAYGLRYLEKLIEVEYELGIARDVEQMAIRQVHYPHKVPYRRVSEMAQQLRGGDFPGVQHIDQLLSLRSLLVPRTMLKIVNRFKRVMEFLREHPLANQLPESYPFWVLFLIAMYYRLNPDHLDDFVRGRGTIYELMKNPGSVQSGQWGNGPFREFCQYADRFGASAGSSLQILRVEHLLVLASIVRESTFDGRL